MRKHEALPLVVALLLSACARQPEMPTGPAAEVDPLALIARGRVDIEGGPLTLAMPVDGLVSQVSVSEGATVTRDQVLVATDMTSARLDEDLARARLAQAKAQVQLLAPKLGAAKLRASRLEQAVKAGAGDGQSADDAREAASESRAELANARAGVDLAAAELERAQYQARGHVLRAPSDGEVLSVTVRPGMRAAQGAPVVTVLPSTARIVRAELPQDAVNSVSPGVAAQVLSDDGRLAVLGDAHVVRIGPTFGQSVLQEDPLQRINERSVECVLAFDRPTGLRVGQRVLVRFPVKSATAAAKGR